MKCIFIGYGVGVKGYKLWDPVAGKVLYRRMLFSEKLSPSPIVVQPEEDEKKLVVQLPPKTEKVEPKNEQEVHDGPDEEEGSESSKEEEETPPQTLRRSTQQRRKPDKYNYSPSDFRCIFSLFANTDETCSYHVIIHTCDTSVPLMWNSCSTISSLVHNPLSIHIYQGILALPHLVTPGKKFSLASFHISNSFLSCLEI
jgi:hypothetical protein